MRNEPQNAWERMTNESARAFRAFEAYRNLGPERSIVKAIELVGKTPAKDRRRWERWSAKFCWVDRAEAYDRHVERERRFKLEEEWRQADERHARIARVVQSKLI